MMLVDKESGKSYVQMEETGAHHKEYASKGVAGTALGLGAGALGLLLLGANRGCNNWLGNLGLGNCGCGCGNGTGEDAAIAVNAANERWLERKECSDYLAITEKYYQGQLDQQEERFNDRQTIDKEFFDLYSAMRNGFDGINAKHNQDAFNLYKYSRDSKDELSAEIGALRTELAVMKATRPYQDALIQCDIRRTAEHADFNLWRRTCRMIQGELVLPNTPTVTGYPSYNPCVQQSASTPTA